MKKAAMFGLDARIALAIFGALSVISGASLYSAIQEAKTTAILVDMQELAKAYESYLLDTGEHVPTSSFGSTHDLAAKELITSTKLGWKGPYTSYLLQNETISDIILDYPAYNYIYLRKTGAADFTASGEWDDVACTTGNLCYVYVIVRGITDTAIFKSLDLKVDGIEDEKNDNFRVFTRDVTEEKRAALLFMTYKN